MKKMKLCMLSLSLLCAFTFIGCGTASESGNREAELEEKVTQLEQQIATLEAEKEANMCIWKR